MKNASMHDVAIARKPRTTITAMAQCGKPESSPPDWTFPFPSEVPPLVPVVEDAVAEGDGLDVAEAPAADVEAIDERTESAYVVSGK